jgi:hypothetical protein
MDDKIELGALLAKFEESIKTKEGSNGVMDVIVDLVQLVVIEGKYIVAMEKDIIEMKKKLK